MDYSSRRAFTRSANRARASFDGFSRSGFGGFPFSGLPSGAFRTFASGSFFPSAAIGWDARDETHRLGPIFTARRRRPSPLQSSECEKSQCAPPFGFRLWLCTHCKETGGFWGRGERDQEEPK